MINSSWSARGSGERGDTALSKTFGYVSIKIVTYSGARSVHGPAGDSHEACGEELFCPHCLGRGRGSWHSCGRVLSWRECERVRRSLFEGLSLLTKGRKHAVEPIHQEHPLLMRRLSKRCFGRGRYFFSKLPCSLLVNRTLPTKES